jgi:membrane protein DedA with SNARE-associated domain
MIFELPIEPTAPPGSLTIVLGIVVATFVSEDLTCIAVGLLLAAGRIDYLPGLAGCFVGIVAGDLGVWLTGRLMGRQAMRVAWVRRRAPERRLAEMSTWLGRHGGKAAFVSRFLPGTRVPLFLTAGVIGQPGGRFVVWAVIAALVWTPAIVLSVAALGDSLAGPLNEAFGHGWIVSVLTIAAGLLALRIAGRLASRTGRAKLAARIAKLWRWEFWPAWLFYMPLVPWCLLLALRYRSLTVWTAANPGIPAGGVVGESKAYILSRLPEQWIVPTLLVSSAPIAERLRAIDNCGWEYPHILKPDAGQRGAGVKKAHDAVDVEKYLLANPGPVIVQPYHPGPFEAGIFYCRMPEEATGRIFSITDKVFPEVIGDGRSTLEELIWRHSRYRMQAATFLARHEADRDRVLSAGERLPLALAGNHCQGTLFRDGAHLITPELERTIDAIARSFDGFYIGRFDVRYRSESDLRDGRGFAVIELNGATSESTNLYDPSWPLVRAYRTLFRQWALLFRIGHENRRRGHEPVSAVELVRLVRAFYRDRTTDLLAD